MTTDPKPDIWSRLSRALGHLFGFVLRLVFVVLLAAGIGGGLYYGLPWAYRSLVEPVQVNRIQIAALAEQFENLRTALAKTQARQEERLTALETGDDRRRESLASAEAALAGLQAELEAEAAARQALEARLAAQQTGLNTQARQIAELQESLQKFAAIEAQVAGLQQELALTRLQNRLLQARLQLTAENLGEARSLLALAVEEMVAVVTTARALDESDRAVLGSRLATARSLIETQPAAALAELESIFLQLQAALAAGSSSPG